MNTLEAQIAARLDALAEGQPCERPPAPRPRRMEWRAAPLRPLPTVAASTAPVPPEARDLEGRYADAPNPLNGKEQIRVCILAVAWGGFGNRTLRATGRNVRTKNAVIIAVEDLSNVSDTP